MLADTVKLCIYYVKDVNVWSSKILNFSIILFAGWLAIYPSGCKTQGHRRRF